MKINREFTSDNQSPYQDIKFKKVSTEIRNPDGSIVFELKDFEVPEQWSQVASDILSQKYFRKAGVPNKLKRTEERNIPSWLSPRIADEESSDLNYSSEKNSQQVFDRLAGAWTYWGWKGGYFSSEEDAKAFFDEVSSAIDDNGAPAALEVCEQTEGPVSAIFHAGLSKIHRGLDDVEKAIQNAGAIQMAFLEKNMIWLNAVITIAPMLGFTGTVVGMIAAFDAIKAANDISPAVVAGGISQALLTTAFGLIVAMIIQTFQNVFVSRIDKLVLDMEEQSVKIMDHLYEQKEK